MKEDKKFKLNYNTFTVVPPVVIWVAAGNWLPAVK